MDTVVEGVPSGELYTVVLSRESVLGVGVLWWLLGAGERSSVSPVSLYDVRGLRACMDGWMMQGWEVSLPLRVLRLDGLRLLALRGGDAAFDGESGTVGAGHPEAGGVASYLMSG